MAWDFSTEPEFDERPEWMRRVIREPRAARIDDGPDEVHQVTVARQILKRYQPVDVRTEHVLTRRAAAVERFAERLGHAAVGG